MARDLDIDIEASWDAQQSADAAIYCLTLQHPRLGETARLVSSPFGDNVGNHVIGGNLYAGVPFNLTPPGDDDQPPRGKIEMLNFGLEIGRAVLLMKTKPRLIIEAYAARDFTTAMSGDPPAHQPIGSPRLLYRAPWLTIRNVNGDTWVTGDIGPFGPDPTSEPASPMRATQDRFPCLFK